MTDVSNTTVHHNGTCIVNGTDFASFNERIPQQKTIRISQKIGKKYNWTDDQVSQIEASFFYGQVSVKNLKLNRTCTSTRTYVLSFEIARLIFER